MSKTSHRLGAAVALVAGATALASGSAHATESPSAQPSPAYTAPDTEQTEQTSSKEADKDSTEEDGNMENLSKCYDVAENKDAFLALHGLDINYTVPPLLETPEGEDGIGLDPVCGGLTYGPFSASSDQQSLPMPTPQPPPSPSDDSGESGGEEAPAEDTDTDTNSPEGDTSDQETDDTSGQDMPDDPTFPGNGDADIPDPFGSLIPGGGDAAGQGNGTDQAGQLLPGLL